MTIQTHPASSPEAGAHDVDVAALESIARRVLWTATAIVDAANRVRPNVGGLKVGGHQASSASAVDIMTSLWFARLTGADRISVKPHASPVLHAISYLLGDLPERHLGTLRELGGLQSYPSRTKDHDRVDFSTGSVGIGATAPLWAAIAHRYLRSHDPSIPAAGRFFSIVGDAELDEGAIWEAVVDPMVGQLGEVTWIVDFNRQSLDRIVPDVQIHKWRGLFEAAGWQVLTCLWGRRIRAVFEAPDGHLLQARLESMPNEEYQRLLRCGSAEAHRRLRDGNEPALAAVLDTIDPDTVGDLLRDLGGHDIPQLLSAYDDIDPTRPTVIFAYTVKGRGLSTQGHPSNHSALLTGAQMEQLAEACGMSLADPWRRFDADSTEGQVVAEAARRLERPAIPVAPPPSVPADLGLPHRRPMSSQAALGRILSELPRAAPELAQRLVTLSPDVASSTNLGGWINKNGVWSAGERTDWFADDPQTMLRWRESESGRHLELGIAEVNLVGLAGELGATWSRWGRPLVPLATMYDPFVSRALEPWSFSMYAGGQSILVGTPSGVTLASEGGAHQSISTPGIGLQQPGCTAWEPAFGQDLEWVLLDQMSRTGVPGGESAYLRLSTRSVDQSLAGVPEDPALRERRRRQVLAGGYRLSTHPAAQDSVVLVGMGALMPNVLAAAQQLSELGVTAGVVCVTSADLLFREFTRREQRLDRSSGAVAAQVLPALFPPDAPAPLVTVLDGHPHTLAFLAGVRGDRIAVLGVTGFGQSSNLNDAHRLHGIDADAIVAAALDLVGH
ncbi:pyruvate dehydrogenase E1 component [Kineosphaera limosa]|uniref:Pyruvate dehydrogenase E1 component n=1 Tax=Kineosphaera limosa NBRC 100340 TaxID=1184609 RepID=K6WW02_9MICO|nr:pyruvate dehydrogenase E1 [Kineosphaera limosa]NYD99231.1 pyruvate dehydrogenase E1 component [Kineosphaera limosa]GAB96267.1 putative pyruvate dehydrogenase E1 component [Kineosphaera limosa NBRC 100340]